MQKRFMHIQIQFIELTSFMRTVTTRMRVMHTQQRNNEMRAPKRKVFQFLSLDVNVCVCTCAVDWTNQQIEL